VDITGDRELTAEEKAVVELHLVTLKDLGFEPTKVIASKDGFTKYICKFVSGDLPKARITLQALGFDFNDHREDGRLAGWAIRKRTTEGKGWQ